MMARFCEDAAETTAIVSPQGWLFQPSYNIFRRELISTTRMHLVAWLGAGAFETISGEVFQACLTINSADKSKNWAYLSIDVSSFPYEDKISLLKSSTNIFINNYDDIIKDADCRLIQHSKADHYLLDVSTSHKGITTSDDPRFIRSAWELSQVDNRWDFMQSTVSASVEFGGMSDIILFENGSGKLRQLAASQDIDRHQDKRGIHVWGTRGIMVSCTGNLPVSQYIGSKFDTNAAVVSSNRVDDLMAIYSYLKSDNYSYDLRKIDKSLKVTNATLIKVPFNLSYWQKVAIELYPDGLPKPHSNDPTQWLFDGHPRGSANPNALDVEGLPTRSGLAEHPLQVAVARLLGYRWPRQTGSAFMDCSALKEPDEIERSGRVDVDGIVCLPSLHGKAGAGEQLRGVLQAAWGTAWAEGVVGECLRAEAARAEDLDAWLADEFFDCHCKLFHQIPFIWHVWDGLSGGFSALVNYHKLCAPDGGGRRLLEKLRDTYLGEWISRQRRAAADGEALAEDRLAAAEHLHAELTRIIEGDPPYDIFVRWKPLSQQAIGWEPDIDDGVRLNIRPFLTARPRNARAKKSCVLRVTPGVKKHEAADRGTEPFRDKAQYPWFWAEDHDVETINFAGGADFKGRRYNDFHYGRAFKHAARRTASGPEAAE